MVKKNSLNPIKLIKYHKLINHNLIYNNAAINRYKKDSYEISADKTDNLEKLKKTINIKEMIFFIINYSKLQYFQNLFHLL